MKIKRITLIALVVVFSLVFCTSFQAMSANTPPKAKEMPLASLIIGTYLIDFEALNEEIQGLAEATAESHSQSKIFYKSELNNGTWYDITNAEGVNDIVLVSSKIVAESVINALTIEFYAKADGTIIDYRNGGAVSTPQGVSSVANPSNMTELSTLLKEQEITKELLDVEKDEDKEELYKQQIAAFDEIFKAVSSNSIDDANKQMEAIDKAINEETDTLKIDELVTLKLGIKAARDKECYEAVNARLENEMANLTKKDSISHSDLVSKLGNAVTEIQAKILELVSQTAKDEASALGKKQNDLKKEVLAAVESGNSSSIDNSLDRLIAFNNIMNGKIDKSLSNTELEILDEMLEEGKSSITEEINSISNGTHPYYTETENGPSQADVTGNVKEIISDLNGFIENAFLRDNDLDKKTEKMNGLGNLLQSLSDSLSTADSLQKELKSLLSKASDSILEESKTLSAMNDTAADDDKNAISDVQKSIDDAYEQYLLALENGDSALSDYYDGLLDQLQQKLDLLQGEKASLIDGLYSEKASLEKEKLENKDVSDALRENAAQLALTTSMLDELSQNMLGMLNENMDAVSDAETGLDMAAAYSEFIDSIGNIGSDLISDETKSDLISMIAAKINDKLGNALSSGDMTSANMLEKLLGIAEQDIIDAKNGLINDNPSSNDGNIGDAPSISDALFENDFVIADYDIYLDNVVLELAETKYVPIREIAVRMGADVHYYVKKYIIKDECVLIEFDTETTTAYINDKMLALSSKPIIYGGILYAPIELLETGFGLTTTEENNTIFMQK